MSFVVQNGGASTCPPRKPPHRSRIGAAIALGFTVFAFVVVACSGSDNVEDVAQQEQRICDPDGEGCGPDPRDPCGNEGLPCCVFGGVQRCATGLSCFNGTCTGCGGTNEPCCAGNACDANHACQGGVCKRTCGAQGLACCSSGTACDSGLACSGGSCQLCGRSGQTCCAGNTCNNGFNCTNGTCNACGAVGQSCCQSGAACGVGSSCVSGVCRQDICGRPGDPCCATSFVAQKCINSPSNYACNPTTNRCEPCGNPNGFCCTSGQLCSFTSSYECQGAGSFNTGTCRHCGNNGESCCDADPFSPCSNGNVCSNGTCRTCGGTGQPCCSGSSSTQCNSGNVCTGFGSSATCQRCGGSGQACCTSGISCSYPLTCRNSTCQSP